MNERKPALVLGYFVGTCTGWDQIDDWAIVLYDFDPYEGFDVPKYHLSVDYDKGTFKNYDDAGEETFTANMIEIMDRFVANKEKLL